MISETQLQALIRVQAPKHRSLLLRNNSGAITDPEIGRHVRFGLGNHSAKLNAVFKSPDLVGITSIQCRCGETYGVFTGLEVKKPGWKFSANNSVHVAQNNFLNKIHEMHGIGKFITSVDDLPRILSRE